MLRLVTFGALALTRDGVPHTGPASQRRRLALLALLAAAGKRGLSRDKLLGYLWPESEPESARHALHQSLHALRRSLETDALFLGTASLQLNPEMISTDVAEFEDALERNTYERAVSLYGGPFLDGFYLEGVVEFERWVDAERARRAREYVAALDALVAGATARKDYVAAARWGRRLAVAEPLNSRAAIGLIEALVSAGDRAGALQFATVHEALVRDELDSPPDPAITEWITRLRAGSAAVGASPQPARAGPGVGSSTAADRAMVAGEQRQIERLARAVGERYSVGQKTADGAVTRTYAARAKREDVPVELHVVQPRLAALASLDTFLHGLGRVTTLSDPNIVPTYDFGVVEDVLFFVTTLMEGTSLRDRIAREQQLPMEEVLRVGRAVAAALAHAHEREVSHGDLRPKHITLAPRRVVVGGFGIVSALSPAEGSSVGSTALALGSPAYQSPEQLSGGARPGTQSDLYSLGCVLYEMLAGEPPFGRSMQPGILARKLTQPPPLIREHRENVPEPLERLLSRCLARSAADRPRSAGEVRHALDQLYEAV
jgi:DNA-binding SARP family transcriptional activator